MTLGYLATQKGHKTGFSAANSASLGRVNYGSGGRESGRLAGLR